MPEGPQPGRGPRAPRGPPRVGRARGSLAAAIAISFSEGKQAMELDLPQGYAEPAAGETLHAWSTHNEEMLAEGVRLYGR